jgi:hypothetical protein
LPLPDGKKNEFYTYPENLFRTTMQCLFWVVLILFSIVKTKIVHYSSLCWLPLTFMSAYAIESINHGIFRFRWYYKAAIFFIGALIAAAFIAFPILMAYYRPALLDLIADKFTKANLSADVSWYGSDALAGIVLVLVLLAFAWFMYLKKPVMMFGILLLGNMLVITLASLILVPKVERHTQRIAIDFFKSKSAEKCYIFHTGYKSYAPYFYGRVKPLGYWDGLSVLNRAYFHKKNAKSYLQLSEQERGELDDIQKEWLLHGYVDRPVYFIAKTNDREGLNEENNLIELWDRNGFVVYKRK